MTRADCFLAAALGYVSVGWKVLPIQPGTKRPWRGRGLDHATNDEDVVRTWWSDEPDLNVAVACAPSGLVVIDTDRRSGGDVAALDLAGDLPATRAVRTPGGLHRYYLDPGVPLRGRLDDVGLPGHDVKSRGYVVAPPSLHPCGDPYVLLTDDEVAPMPQWLVDIARKPEPATRSTPRTQTGPLDARQAAYVDTAVRNEVDRVARAQEGKRNNTLASAAWSLGQLVGGGVLDQQRAEAALLHACETNLLARDEPVSTLRTLRGQLTDGAKRPRTAPDEIDDARTLLETLAASTEPCETAELFVDTPDAMHALAAATRTDALRHEWGAAHNRLRTCGGGDAVQAFLARILRWRDLTEERR